MDRVNIIIKSFHLYITEFGRRKDKSEFSPFFQPIRTVRH